jgi:hypothetical protein
MQCTKSPKTLYKLLNRVPFRYTLLVSRSSRRPPAGPYIVTLPAYRERPIDVPVEDIEESRMVLIERAPRRWGEIRSASERPFLTDQLDLLHEPLFHLPASREPGQHGRDEHQGQAEGQRTRLD